MTATVDQLTTTPTGRDLAWLREALQSAIALEHSTLPLYLSAMFSLEVQNYPSYNAIRSVAMEEMVHMAIAANLLAAIGGSPRIRDLDPGYPCHGLPGGAEPDLYAGLAQLSRRQLRNFTRLEAPRFLLPDAVRKEGYPTIGALYRAIRQAVKENAEAVRAAVAAGGPANQVGDDIGFTTISATRGTDPVDQFDAAIDEIVEQGEGSGSGDIETGSRFQGEESHYARFAELLYGARYREPDPPVPLTTKSEPEFFGGSAIAWPVVVNTLAVPADGYDRILADDPDRAEVSKQLDAFDRAYTSILDKLDTCWNGPAATSWPTLGAAVDAMMSLRVLSCFNIVRHQVPPPVVNKLAGYYSDEYAFLSEYTDLSRPVYYGPRFRNQAATGS
jgi:hypothetical protein